MRKLFALGETDEAANRDKIEHPIQSTFSFININYLLDTPIMQKSYFTKQIWTFKGSSSGRRRCWKLHLWTNKCETRRSAFSGSNALWAHYTYTKAKISLLHGSNLHTNKKLRSLVCSNILHKNKTKENDHQFTITRVGQNRIQRLMKHLWSHE